MSVGDGTLIIPFDQIFYAVSLLGVLGLVLNYFSSGCFEEFIPLNKDPYWNLITLIIYISPVSIIVTLIDIFNMVSILGESYNIWIEISTIVIITMICFINLLMRQKIKNMIKEFIKLGIARKKYLFQSVKRTIGTLLCIVILEEVVLAFYLIYTGSIEATILMSLVCVATGILFINEVLSYHQLLNKKIYKIVIDPQKSIILKQELDTSLNRNYLLGVILADSEEFIDIIINSKQCITIPKSIVLGIIACDDEISNGHIE